MEKITFSPRISLSHSRAYCSHSSQNQNQEKQKLREAESRRVLPPKLRAGLKTGRGIGLGWGTPGAGGCKGGESSPLRDLHTGWGEGLSPRG